MGIFMLQFAKQLFMIYYFINFIMVINVMQLSLCFSRGDKNTDLAVVTYECMSGELPRHMVAGLST